MLIKGAQRILHRIVSCKKGGLPIGKFVSKAAGKATSASVKASSKQAFKEMAAQQATSYIQQQASSSPQQQAPARPAQASVAPPAPRSSGPEPVAPPSGQPPAQSSKVKNIMEDQLKAQQESAKMGEKTGTTTKGDMRFALIMAILYDLLLDVIIPLLTAFVPGGFEIIELVINFFFQGYLQRKMGSYFPSWTIIEYVPGLDILPIYTIATFLAYRKFCKEEKKQKSTEKTANKLQKKGEKQVNKEQEAQAKAAEKAAGGSPGRGLPKFGGMGGSGGEMKPPIFSIIVIIASLLIGLLIYKSYSDSGTTNLAILLAPLAGAAIGMFLLGFIGQKSGAAMGIGMLLVFASVYGCATQTGPAAAAAWQAGKFGDFIIEAQDQPEQLASRGLSTLIEDTLSSYKSQMAMATGEKIDGDVDEQVKEEVGVEILPPYLPNPKKINEDETGSLEFSARMKGFDPKTEIQLRARCGLQTQAEATDIRRVWREAGSVPDFETGVQQNIRPATFNGYNFDQEITCYPQISECGKYVITLNAEADRLRTDAQMINYIIQKDVLDTRLRHYADSRNQEIRSESQLHSAIQAIYPGQLGNYKSVSQKGAIKVVMGTQPVPLIGVDDNTDLKLRIGIENTQDGWIRGINSVKATIPGYFEPIPEFCQNWELQGGLLILGQEYIDRVNFGEVVKGQQKIFPSCLLTPTGDYELTEPTEATFLVAVDYKYLIQEEYELDVRNQTGGVCRTQTSNTGTGSAQQSGAQQTSTQQNQPVVYEKLKSVLPQSEPARAACEGKPQGYNCAIQSACTEYSGQMVCAPMCIHKAVIEQIDSAYDCVTPMESCAPNTIIGESCTTSFSQLSFKCCKT
ncbi:hypothetical protein HQ545_01230 [Candidatus Woesearchaeota archaeon]|nr:hypothetical protein [Candidatus Woesearchaeota archaeon]